MGALVETSEVLWDAVKAAGLADAFEGGNTAFEDCPACDHKRGLKLNLRSGRAHCSSCGIDGALLTYLHERDEAQNWREDEAPEAQIIVLEPRLPRVAVKDLRAARVRAARDDTAEIAPTRRGDGKLGERIIMTLLALVFLCAGLAAAGLSGFANFQAFSASVSDPLQARIWGWSGVIASVCSFGGFTFFWWHSSARRFKEGLRALVFALAGAGTSIAGTAMFMANNNLEQKSAALQIERTRDVVEAQISDWSRQLEGIPAATRSVAGLEAYIAGVEQAGRTHHKPYRDAQNELGLARRRAELESRLGHARAQLLGQSDDGAAMTVAPQRKSLPAWFFALMLEVFSSQGTSIALVSLLLLYGRRSEVLVPQGLGADGLNPEPQPG